MLKTIECPKCQNRVVLDAERLGAYYNCPRCGDSFATEGAVVSETEGSLPARPAPEPVDPRVVRLDSIDKAAYGLAFGILAVVTVPLMLPPLGLGVGAILQGLSARKDIDRAEMPASASTMSAISLIFGIAGIIGALVFLAFWLSADQSHVVL